MKDQLPSNKTQLHYNEGSVTVQQNTTALQWRISYRPTQHACITMKDQLPSNTTRLHYYEGSVTVQHNTPALLWRISYRPTKHNCITMKDQLPSNTTRLHYYEGSVTVQHNTPALKWNLISSFKVWFVLFSLCTFLPEMCLLFLYWKISGRNITGQDIP